jgi:type VI secretion system secreted protein VgrG
MNIPGVEGLVDPKAALQQAAGEKVSQAAQGVTQVAQAAQNPTAAVSDLAGNQLGELASNAVSIPVEAPASLDAVSLPAGDVSGAVGNAASNLQGAAGNAVSNVQNAAGNAVSGVQNAAGNAVSAVQDAAGNAVSGVQDAAGNAVSGVKDAAAEKIAKAKDAGGDLFDTPFDEMFSSADASPFSQENRLIKLQLGDGEDLGLQLLPQSVTGDEAINTPYRYTVLCDSPDDAIDLRKLIGIIAQLDILTGEGGIKNLALSASSGADEKNVVRTGIITKAEALPSDGGFAKYRLTIEPAFSLLRQRYTARVFQDKNVPKIIQTIIDEHRADNTLFGKTFTLRFDLLNEADYLPRSYCLQYRETDLEFIERLLAEEGLAYTFEHSGAENASPGQGDGKPARVEMVVFDNPSFLKQAEEGQIRYHREGTTEESDSIRDWRRMARVGIQKTTLASYDYKPVIVNVGEDEDLMEGSGVAAEATLEDYDPQTLYYAPDADQLTRYARLRQLQVRDREKHSIHGAGNVRQILAGQWFELIEHPAYDRLQEEDRRFVVAKLHFVAHSNVNDNKLAVGEKPPKPYDIEFDAYKLGTPLNPAYAHTKHAKPTAPNRQTAIVVGPPGEEIYTDADGRIKIQFHWQRGKEHPEIGANLDENSSCWIRVSYPSAGAGWGHQFIPRIGHEVIVEFLEGDIDRPIVTGSVYDGANPVPWFSGVGNLPQNRTLSGIKTKEYKGAQYNELLLDDTQGEVRAKLSSEHGKTQLNEGYLIHPRKDGVGEPRGDGFELRTDRHGALRAGEGLLITTEAKTGASGKQIDRETALAQLQSAQKVTEEWSNTAKGQNADPAEVGPETLDDEGAQAGSSNTGNLDHLVDAVAAWEAGTNTDKDSKTANEQAGRQKIILASAPDGMAVVTPNEMALSTGKNLYTVTHRDLQQTTARRWIHNVGKKISLFVHGVADKINLKITAALGHINWWAQSGNVEITAEKNVNLYAVKKQLHMVAKQSMLFTCAGAYIKLEGGNIDVHAPGVIDVKGADYDFSGPTSLTPDHPAFPTSTFEYPLIFKIARTAYDGASTWKGMPYKLFADGALVKEGVLDDEGNLSVNHNPTTQKYKVELANGATFNIPVVNDFRNTSQGPASSAGYRKYESGAAAADGRVELAGTSRDRALTATSPKS